MKLLLTFILPFVIFFSCSEGKRPLKGETDFQRDLNAVFKDASKSPLKDKDRKTFEGLEFFKFDSTYIVTANFKRTPNAQPFKMQTTTDRTPTYIKYGEAVFHLNGKPHSLNLYMSLDMEFGGVSNTTLFLPFLDETNGLESYGGGRYIDTEIPTGSTVIIDFNTAYNPYCAYNDKYSCPLVPRDNYLKTRVEAGVMAFGKG
ncbi:DUF1684 domain-containing protein [Flavobacteriaceae bacterium MHTCC 0001]